MNSEDQNNIEKTEQTAAEPGKKKVKKKRTLLQKIVNGFLYFFLGLLILLIIFIGISQTSVFQNFLREKIIEIANSGLNGDLYIGEIEGTIFTSLKLKNTVVSMEEDTLLNSGSILVKTSPLQLLLKKIKVREVEIKNTSVSLLIDSNGELNLSKLFPESETTDTTNSEFPFTIEVANLELNNVDLFYRQYFNKNSTANYDSLNMDDFRAENLNLSLSAFADINKNEYAVEIDNFSVKPNINSFILKDLTGAFLIYSEELAVKNLHINTGFSDIEISANLENFSLFDSTGNSDITRAPLELNLLAADFNFNDLNVFVPSTEILKGSVFTDLSVNGTLANLNLDYLGIEYNNTHIEADGTIENVIDGEAIFINTKFYNMQVDQSDVNNLLPSLDLPAYEDYGLLRFDTLNYAGTPLNFKSEFFLRTDKGNIGADLSLNLEPENIEYNLKFNTQNFDISPVAGVSSNLNLNGNINGKGTDPAEYLAADINLFGKGSSIKENNLDSLVLSAQAKNKNIDFDLIVKSDTAEVDIAGIFNFENKDNPEYKVDGTISKFNVASVTDDTSLVTSINIDINAEGENFNPEKMNLFLVMTLYQTSINDVFIDSTRAIVDLRRDDHGERIINVISDLADITLQGNFSITETIDLAGREAEIISSAIQNKINEIIPPDSLIPENNNTQSAFQSTSLDLSEPVSSVNSFDYLIDFKDFDLISHFIKNQKMEVDGDISGKFMSNGSNISLSLNSSLNYLKYWGKKDIFFISNFNLETKVENSFAAESLQDITLDMILNTERVFAGTDIYDINLALAIENNKGEINFSSRLEDIASVNLDGNIDLTGSNINLSLDTLDLLYKKYRMRNKEQINIVYNNEDINIKNFNLSRNGGSIEIDGSLSKSGSQNLKVVLNNLNALDISTNILDMRPENSINAEINLTTNITGNFSNPVIDMDFEIDDVIFKNKNFGVLNGSLDYNNKNLKTDINFIDSLFTKDKPALSITGNIPIDLSFEGSEELFIEGKGMDISLIAEEFNLGAFGDVLPAVNRLRGNLTANLRVTGTPDNLNPDGTIILRNGAFFLEANNLEYNAGLKVDISKTELSLDSLLLANVKGTKNGGTMQGRGSASLNNLDITSSQFSISGILKILGEESRSASPSVYGDLVIGTEGNIEFILNESRALLKAPIVIRHANLTFPPAAGGYQAQSENFIYKFIEDTSSLSEREMDFESLVELSKKRDETAKNSTGMLANFDYRINVTVREEATVTFVLSREFNQDLTAVLSGEILYEKLGGKPDIQGELKLLDGSTLEFIKTLTADGSIRFESELSNPYLNITATYSQYYTPRTENGETREVPVEVRIRIEGPLKQLNEKLIQGENNIAVYYGEESIQNNEPTAKYDASDAIYFLITDQFKDMASEGDRDLVTSQAFALAGSLAGGFLNKQLGPLVKNIEVRKAAGNTRISIEGRAGEFRYTVGGTTDVFKDLSEANVRIEYPVIESLILRLERKEKVTGTSINTQMINEFGIKYRFSF